jgi:hypothetical protein
VAPEQSARAAPTIAFRTLRVLQSIILAAQLVVMLHEKKKNTIKEFSLLETVSKRFFEKKDI